MARNAIDPHIISFLKKLTSRNIRKEFIYYLGKYLAGFRGFDQSPNADGGFAKVIKRLVSKLLVYSKNAISQSQSSDISWTDICKKNHIEYRLFFWDSELYDMVKKSLPQLQNNMRLIG
jgi:hypothetical protein